MGTVGRRKGKRYKITFTVENKRPNKAEMLRRLSPESLWKRKSTLFPNAEKKNAI